MEIQDSGHYTEKLNIEQLTKNQPFCAGVIAFFAGKLIVTLNADGLPPSSRNMLRIGAVGGGQEPLESILDCALREAKEELSVQQVKALPAPSTFFHDMDLDEIRRIETVDKIAPFLVQRQTNARPHTPYKPGLPTGPFVYFNLFLAQIIDVTILPGDDVVGLLLVPLDQWELLQQPCTLREAVAQGIELITRNDTPQSLKDAILYLPKDESLLTAVPLLRESMKQWPTSTKPCFLTSIV